MNDKNYLEKIKAKIGFIAKYFRILRLLIIIAYLIYLETLVVSVFSAVEYIPSIEEVKQRFSPIAAKNEVINSIENYFSDKENSLAKNLQKEVKNNPFAPHKTDDSNLIDNSINPENNVIN